MKISIDIEKVFDYIQLAFMIRVPERVGLEGAYLNIIKAVFEKPTTNIFLNELKIKPFPLMSVLSNIILEILAEV